MNDLFGVSMDIIAAVSIALTVGIMLLVAYIAWRNPVMFKLGLRNIPRRKAQFALIVVGLMLSTLIISAAFGTGDTLTTSVTPRCTPFLARPTNDSGTRKRNPAPLRNSSSHWPLSKNGSGSSLATRISRRLSRSNARPCRS